MFVVDRVDGARGADGRCGTFDEQIDEDGHVARVPRVGLRDR